MSSTSQDDEKKLETSTQGLTLNEAHHLRKHEIIEHLRQRGVQVDESENRDILRSQLVELVKAEKSRISDEKTSVDPQGQHSIAESSSTESKHTGNNGERISEDSETESTNSSSSDDIMSKDTKIFFHLETDDWESFSERLELFFEAKKITEAGIKKAELLTRCDENTYKLFRNLCAPDKPATKTYEELKKLLTEHLKPTPSEVMERCCTYNRARQDQNETVAEFAARLRQLSLHCNFTELETALHDQFICGIRDDATRVELFKQSKVTFDSALKEATARERAVKNAAGVQQTLADKMHKQENFALEHANSQRHGQQQGKIANNEKKSFQEQGDNPKRNSNIVCYCCGYTGHPTKSCR